MRRGYGVLSQQFGGRDDRGKTEDMKDWVGKARGFIAGVKGS
jgi:hypothetical protein